MISVSIVTYYNTLDQISECVNSFISSSLISKIIICDNSENPSLNQSLVSSINDKLLYVSNPSNTGYGAGHNLAFSMSGDSLYHVVMNLDVGVNKDVFEKLSQFMSENSDVVHIMPKVLNTDGSIQRLCKMLPTPMNLIGRRFIRNRGFAASLDEKYTLFNYNYDFILDCPYLSGCFMFLRRSAFVSVDGFDESFFMYPEDIDLSRRLHEVGRTICYPYVSITHEHGQASYKSINMLFIHIQGIVKYFNKWGWFFDKKRKVFNQSLESKLTNKF
ncbi:glycosyltransferase [Vibrio cyclitrophicus]